jgi:hypothetical protein
VVDAGPDIAQQLGHMLNLIEQDWRLQIFEEAARVSGAGTFKAFKTVVIPILAPALLTVFLAGLIRSLEAFQILQLKGIKSRLLVFPDEGHWVLKPQDGLLWQREFFRWLNETL